MDEYVSRKAAQDEACDRCNQQGHCNRPELCPVMISIKNIPAANVRPAVLGRGKLMDELVKALRETDFGDTCVLCEHEDMCKGNDCIIIQAANAIEELQKRVPKRSHGRLGDLDELEKSFREDADAEWNRFAAPVNWADAFDDVANIVADTPTIIPANPAEECK